MNINYSNGNPSKRVFSHNQKYTHSESDLTEQINNFIKKNENLKIINIKYSISSTINTREAHTTQIAALLIYEKQIGI